MTNVLLVILACLFLLMCVLDWMEFKEELEDMWDDEEDRTEEEEQGTDDNRGAAGSDS